MFCNHCGAKIPDGTQFCTNCGQSVFAQPNSQQSSPPQPGQAPSSIRETAPPVATKTSAGTIVMICLLGVIAAAALIFLGIKLFASSNANTQAFAQAYESLMQPATYGNPAVVQSSPVLSEPPETASTSTPTPVPTVSATAPIQNAQDADTVFANGFVIDVADYLADTWWASAGISIDNPDAATIATGYPKVYNLDFGENQYIFHEDTQTVQMLCQEANGEVTDYGEYDYTLDPMGFYLYSFNRTLAIDGIDHEIYSAFFVCDNVLYEVEMMDGYEVSNYIAYSIYGP